MPYLKIVDRNGKISTMEITKDRYVIGRDKECDIQLDDQTVSRRHAEIFKFGEHYIIKDMNATNGVYVNNDKIDEEILKHKDEVIVGTTLLIFEDMLTTEETSTGQQESVTDTGVRIVKEGELNKVLEADMVVSDFSHFDIVTELAEVIRNVPSKDEKFYSFLCEKISTYFASQSVHLLNIDPAKSRIAVKGYFTVGGEKNAFSSTIVKSAISTQKPVITPNALSDDKFSYSESIVMRRIGPVMCVPYMFGDEKFALYMHRVQQKPYTQREFDLALLVGAILWGSNILVKDLESSKQK